jgi:hypothetical protein
MFTELLLPGKLNRIHRNPNVCRLRVPWNLQLRTDTAFWRDSLPSLDSSLKDARRFALNMLCCDLSLELRGYYVASVLSFGINRYVNFNGDRRSKSGK